MQLSVIQMARHLWRDMTLCLQLVRRMLQMSPGGPANHPRSTIGHYLRSLLKEFDFAGWCNVIPVAVARHISARRVADTLFWVGILTRSGLHKPYRLLEMKDHCFTRGLLSANRAGRTVQADTQKHDWFVRSWWQSQNWNKCLKAFAICSMRGPVRPGHANLIEDQIETHLGTVTCLVAVVWNVVMEKLKAILNMGLTDESPQVSGFGARLVSHGSHLFNAWLKQMVWAKLGLDANILRKKTPRPFPLHLRHAPVTFGHFIDRILCPHVAYDAA